LIRRKALKKVATTSDIAIQILLLASPVVSGHITGRNIVIAGEMEEILLNVPVVHREVLAARIYMYASDEFAMLIRGTRL
jgi:hypothetical protein